MDGNIQQQKKRICKEIEQAIVKISLFDEEATRGTGFFISKSYVLTAYHCIESQYADNYIEISTGQKFLACLDNNKSFPEHDIAVLKIDDYQSPYYLPLLPIIPENIQGNEVTAFGYPAIFNKGEHELGWYPTEISRFHEGKLEISIKEKGMSGGPVYDWASRRVLGIAFQANLDVATGLAQPLSPLFEHWSELKKLSEEATQIWDERLQHPAPKGLPQWFGYDKYWVERETIGSNSDKKTIESLTHEIQNKNRILMILGLTGIGKTALAERITSNLGEWLEKDWTNRFRRANFDYTDKATDFVTVATRWLEEWGERLAPEEVKPEHLLPRLVKRLCDNRTLVLVDSLERLLTGGEDDDEWGGFEDEWWEKFFLHILSAESCESRIIITSQDLPIELDDSRYGNFIDKCVLFGLSEAEQTALFKIAGFDMSEDSFDKPILLRLAKAYKGHPLVLRVILGEILEGFQRNVQAYWEKVSTKVIEVEKAVEEAENDANKIIGSQDDWKLHKLTRKVRRQVNNERLKSVFERLSTQVRDAYILICASSVYRIPVQEEGWTMQLAALIKRLEKQNCSQERQKNALEELDKRFLAEKSFNHNGKLMLGQHNLIRSVALEHNKQMILQLKKQIE